jgi:predicted MFS family arabinose efflux permease
MTRGSSPWKVEGSRYLAERIPDSTLLTLPGEEFYTIPYRSLLPLKVENVIMAGRFMSGDHEALASFRVMGPAMVMGHAAGIAALVAADVVLARSGELGALGAGIVLWGLHMGLTQGLLSALVADASPAALRGTAFGVFNFVSGVALLAASVLAGWLWQSAGAPATFYAGAALAALALLGLLAVHYRKPA